jgi:hypothetical protein
MGAADLMSDPRQESEDAARARRGRNIALALGLVVFVILVFIVTLVRLGANVLEPRF